MTEEKTEKSIDFVVARVKELGVSLHLDASKQVTIPETTGPCSGYFITKPPTLCVAMGRPDWYSILLHEFHHMEQWAAKCPLFDAAIEAWDVLSHWFNGEKVEKETLLSAVDAAQACEWDCEKRTIAWMEQNGMPTKTYAKKANAYIWFYSYLKDTGEWYTVPPYDFPDIVAQLPETLLSSVEEYTLSEKPELHNAFAKAYPESLKTLNDTK